MLYHVLISIVVAISGTPEKMKQNQKKSNPISNYLPYIGSINLFFSYQNRYILIGYMYSSVKILSTHTHKYIIPFKPKSNLK